MTETVVETVQSQTVFQVLDFVDAHTLRNDLTYSPNNLSDAMMNQASLFAHYGVLAAQASRQVDVVKLLLENTTAAVYQLVANEKAAAGEKVTVPMMEALVARHARVVAMKKALNEAKRVESICKIAVESFRHRKDMLVSQGLQTRQEMKGEVYLAEKNARESAADYQKQALLARIGKRDKDEEAA